MDKFELATTLEEFGVDAPDRCKTCPRLGGLAARLSVAQGNRNLLITSTDEAVIIANSRARLTAQVKERYSGLTDEQIAAAVERSLVTFLKGDKYIEYLKQAGDLLEAEDNNITLALDETIALIDNCPPEGCSTNL